MYLPFGSAHNAELLRDGGFRTPPIEPMAVSDHPGMAASATRQNRSPRRGLGNRVSRTLTTPQGLSDEIARGLPGWMDAALAVPHPQFTPGIAARRRAGRSTRPDRPVSHCRSRCVPSSSSGGGEQPNFFLPAPTMRPDETILSEAASLSSRKPSVPLPLIVSSRPRSAEIQSRRSRRGPSPHRSGRASTGPSPLRTGPRGNGSAWPTSSTGAKYLPPNGVVVSFSGTFGVRTGFDPEVSTTGEPVECLVEQLIHRPAPMVAGDCLV
jgi:hypothetical protein